MTTHTLTYPAGCLIFSVVASVVLLCSGFVLAQEPAAATTVETSFSTTTTPVATTSSAVSLGVSKRPYQVETISGNNLQVGDFVVGPGRVEVTVKPGETVVKNILVTNRVSNGRTFRLEVEDMSGSADPTQSVVLLGDQKGPYTLKDNITYASDTFDLDLGERAMIPVSITMPPNAEPGGYYGAVLVSTVETSEITADDVTAHSPIVTRIGTLFFITVPGDTKISGTITDFSTKNNQWWYEKGPIDMSIVYENTGSVHLNPYGEIRVKNIFGEEVGFQEIDPWFILPRALRLREVSWDRQFLFGRYTITASINRGYDNIVDEKVIHIWVLPWKILLAIFVTLFIVFSLIRFMFTHFEFKRKTT